MMRALYSGVSGLKTHQTKMDVIGNNIANVNTVAFKSSSVTFTDIMYQTTSGASGATATTGGKNATQIGLGVTSGSTKVSITSAGAAQSTGEAFDIKLTDSNSTNFFIVSNGSETLFTRSGSFYPDGNGNLCMSSTGYMVMGWQVDPNTGDIRKDTVSALRVMQPSNLTSAPEATTNATVSGLVDKNDTGVNSENGYAMSLKFYDALGYSYNAKFSVKSADTTAGTYTVELSNIYDEDNQDILVPWLAAGNNLNSLFGTDTTSSKSYALDDSFTATTSSISTVDESGNVLYLQGDPTTQGGVTGYTFATSGVTPEVTKFISLAEMYGIDEETIASGTIATATDGTGALTLTTPTTNYTLQFNKADGTFSYVNAAGNDSVSLNMTALGPQFADIDIDFSQCLNQEHGGSSTLGIEKGAVDGTTGVGKKLGTMTGISIDGTGKIYGTYDNGNNVLLGQIAVAQFANASGLESLGNSCYSQTLNSGEFDGIGVEVTADGGSMATGQLEMSNVDLSAEFTEMITTQRGFQANSRIITTSDALLEELVNLKR